MNEQTKFDEWAIVELFGHQKIAGKVSEAPIAGGAFLRVDVPTTERQPGYTRFFGPGAIYSINPAAETLIRQWCERNTTEPVSRYEFPQIAEKVESRYEAGFAPDDE